MPEPQPPAAERAILTFPCELKRLNRSLTGRYVIEGEVGRGGSAVVFRAADVRHGRRVALKVLDPALTDHVGRERFQREIAITARLQHPHILPLLDSGTANGMVFFATPFVGGGSLRDRLRGGRVLSLGDVLRWGAEVAGALAYAHGEGVVHLDVKPENILLSGGHAVVADFGIARAVCDTCPVVSEDGGLIVGTPAYMSPEQADGTGVDSRSDVYSFGCLLFELLTGRPPFDGITPEQILARDMTEVPSLRSIRSDAPIGIERVVTSSLAPLAADRPPTMRSVLAVLGAPAGGTRRAVTRWRTARQTDLFGAITSGRRT